VGAWTARQRRYVEQWNEDSAGLAGGDDGSADQEPAPADVSLSDRAESSSSPQGVAEDLDDSTPISCLRARTIAADRLSRAERAALVPYPEDVERPRTRGECAGGPRPCPFVSCSHHLYLDVTYAGGIKFNFPGIELEELADTCSLDLADQGGLTLEQVGEATNLTRERVRQIEMGALVKLGKLVDADDMFDASRGDD
jgi:hypothetical protein